jgi:hypothetical protein
MLGNPATAAITSRHFLIVMGVSLRFELHYRFATSPAAHRPASGHFRLVPHIASRLREAELLRTG